MNIDEDERIEEYNSSGEKSTPVIEFAKKAIEAIRNDISGKKTTPKCKICEKKHPPFQPCAGTETEGKSKQLTEKAIEAVCGDTSTEKAAPTCKITGEKHSPLFSYGAEAEENAKDRANTIAEAEERAKAEAHARVKAEERAKFEADARARAEERVRASAVTIAQAEEKARLEAEARAKAEEKAEIYAEAIAEAQKKLRATTRMKARAETRVKREVEARLRAETAAPFELEQGPMGHAETAVRGDEKGQTEAKLTESSGMSIRIASCDCCDNEGVVPSLTKIDSGQLLCPDCLKSLRDTASRITIP